MNAYEIAKLNEREVVRLLLGGQSVMIVAAPGAGKSHLLVGVAEACASAGGNTLVTSFNVKAVEKLEQASVAVSDVTICRTLDGLLSDAYRMIHPERDWIEGPAREDLFHLAVREAGRDDPGAPSLARQWLDLLDEGKPKRGAPPGAVVSGFRAIKAARGVFDGLEVRAFAKSSPKLVVDYLLRLKVVRLLVDEVQDLSAIEIAILRAARDAGIVLCLVGDPEQAINGYRGAHLEAVKILCSMEAMVVGRQDITFRMREVLCADLNRRRGRLFGHTGKMIAAQAGGTALQLSTYCGNNDDIRHQVLDALGLEVLVALGRPVPRMLRGVASSRAEQARLGLLRGAGLRDLAILVPTNPDLDAVEGLLTSLGVTAVRLSRRPADPRSSRGARLLLAALDPHSHTSQRGASRGETWGIRVILDELRRRPGASCSRDEQQVIDTVLAEIHHLASARGQSSWRAVGRVLDGLGSVPERSGLAAWHRAATRLAAVIEAGEQGPSVRATARILSELDASFDLRAKASDAARGRPWLRCAQLVEGSGQPPLEAARTLRVWQVRHQGGELEPLKEGQRRVVISTIHVSKGLTFEATWVAALRRRQFPYHGQDSKSERCKAWVAITRAERLVIVHVHETDRRYFSL